MPPDVDIITGVDRSPSSQLTQRPTELERAASISSKTPSIPNQHTRPISTYSRHSSSTGSRTTDRNHVDDDSLEDNSGVPKLSLWRLFWFFLTEFGIHAWGGSVGQIALMKEKLVVQDQWVSLQRFQRVFAVYQILPGPEAAEMCMFFGCLSAGRWGGAVAGMGFILPGFLLMLTASVLYVTVDVQNVYIQASFKALRAVVAAMIFRATHSLADHVLTYPKTGKPNPYLIASAIFTVINSALHINIFISLFLYGIIYTLITRRWYFPAILIFILQYVVFGLYVHFKSFPSEVSLALGIAPEPTIPSLLALGLVAGSLSFGGAYTAFPFVQAEAVLLGKWIPLSTFIEGIAIGQILPAPLVIFVTFVGFQGGYYGGNLEEASKGGGEGNIGMGFAGSAVMTVGMFLPCFLFTIMGHTVLEKLVRNKFLAAFFEGLCGAVIGVIAITAFSILKQAVGEPPSKDPDGHSVVFQGPATVIFGMALAAAYRFDHKYTSLLIVICGAVAGQFLFVDKV
ncbi:chromate transporter [Ascobolus immersus RN42]|uniref:Chromate transporter n=1 Tax=Ascobolus immersus RN42 TaxID=1160509 RepID=A0A3N4IEZ7_ASCIM|nr:chromate transporter [Ascobolus immersus RN42]